jgi:hypothetical protein
MSRLARVAMTIAARRWPARMRDEWLAEMAALPSDRARLSFAASLLTAPSPEGTRGGAIAVGGGVTLLAASLANAVHTVGPILMLAAAGVMALAGLRLRMSAPVAVALVGPALFGFLLIGNEVAVMPFMGIADVGPATLVWTGGLLLATRTSRPAPLITATAATMSAATIAGSWHAASTLAISRWSAPAWLPQTLLPRPSTAPPGSADLLIGNAAAMVAPMLLCAVFVVALAMRPPAAPAAALRSTRWRVVAGLVAAPLAVVVCQVTTSSGTAVSTAPHRLLDHTAVFGFGFAANAAGQAAVALIAAVLAVRLTEPTA